MNQNSRILNYRYGGPYSSADYTPNYPDEVSKRMEDGIAPIRERYAPLLEPKAGLVETDAAGNHIPSAKVVKPWMQSRKLNIAPGYDGPMGPDQGPQQKVLDAKTAAALLQRANGDKDAARKLATQMGYQIPQLQ